MYLLTIGFNLKRDASPVATNNGNYNHGFFFGFQSQARCQPRGDLSGIGARIGGNNVSISSEMPAPWRLWIRQAMIPRSLSFNLKRDASPVATTRERMKSSRAKGFNLKRDASPVATSGNPIWVCEFTNGFNLKRDASPVATLRKEKRKMSETYGFNLKRDASPVATLLPILGNLLSSMFQSQARCQPRGDLQAIADENRRKNGFNLKRDASPVATAAYKGGIYSPLDSFNLKRDASPVATEGSDGHALCTFGFQSQARCQPRGDL